MAHYQFTLPDLGEGIAEGEVTAWLVVEGDVVEEDTMLLEVETDKATVEIPSPVAGTVTTLGATEGEIVAVGDVLVEFEVAEDAVSATTAPPQASTAPAATSSPATRAPEGTAEGRAAAPQALPAVRALARRLDVDLGSVTGSGPSGRVTEDDVREAATGGAVPAATADDASPAASPRRTIAARLTRAAGIPTVTNVDDVELERVLAAGISPLTALARAVVVSLADHPRLNAFAEDGVNLVPQAQVHLGVAAQTDRGLMVPVVRDAQDHDVEALAAAIADVTERAREGHSRPGELGGSTFTLTSAGRLAGLFSTPLLNPPEVAILGIYRVEPRPVVREGEVVVRRMSNLSITFDHRVLDGMDAARFLAQVRQVLEGWPAGA